MIFDYDPLSIFQDARQSQIINRKFSSCLPRLFSTVRKLDFISFKL